MNLRGLNKSAFFSPLIILLYICSVAFGAAINARDTSINPTAQKFINWLHSHPTEVASKNICFYSGSTTIKRVSEPVWKYIQDFASKKGCQTNSDLITLSKSNTTGWADEDWLQTSIAIAEAASKDPTYTLIGSTIRQNSVWLQGELPTLEKNPNVRTIQVLKLTNTGEYAKIQDLVKT